MILVRSALENIRVCYTVQPSTARYVERWTLHQWVVLAVKKHCRSTTTVSGVPRLDKRERATD